MKLYVKTNNLENDLLILAKKVIIKRHHEKMHFHSRSVEYYYLMTPQ